MFKNYFKIAWRNLRRHKGYAFVNIFGLAIGITCCVLILLYVRHELSYDRFHENAGRIYRVAVDSKDANGNVRSFARVGAPWGPALAQDYPEVLKAVRFRYVFNVLVRRGEQQFYEPNGLYADPDIFEIFSFPLIQGDPQTALAEPNHIVVTKRLAAKYFGKADPMGRVLNIEGDDFTVAGVLEEVPDNSHFSFDFLLPFSVHAAARPSWMANWQRWNYHVYLLLRDKNEAPVLQAKMPGFLGRYLDKEDANRQQAVLQPLTSIHLHSHRSVEFEANGNVTTIILLAAIALFIVLIACINFMNLATARSVRRAKEVGLRKVVGAQRRQLIAQFLGESIVISLLALLVAVFFIELALPRFNALTGKALSFSAFGETALLFVFVVIGLIVGLLSGSYPAFYLSAFRPAAVLKGANTGGRGAIGLRRFLVVVQFAASIALIVCVGVVLEQLQYLQNKKLGLQQEQVVVIPMRDNSVRQKHEAMKAAFSQIPNVRNVAISSGNLGGGDWGHTFRPEGTGEDAWIGTRMLCIDYDYLETLGMELAAGRGFSRAFATDFNDAFLLNETAAKQLGGENPVGHRIEMPGGRKGAIVGVLKDFHFRSLHEAIEPMVMFIQPENANVFSVRIQPQNTGATLDKLRATWHRFAPDRPFVYSFLDDDFAAFYQAEQRLSRVFAAFAVIAIFVACLGLFGLAAFAAEQRIKEIGIRKVLGASVASLLSLLSKDFVKLVLLANLIAWPAAYFAMNKWLQNFAYRVEMGWWVFALAGGMALVIALLTVSTQAIKAALANPVEALRYE